MYIFGGRDKNGYSDDKFFKIDLNSMTWTNINNAQQVGKRIDHSLVGINNSIFVFGCTTY